MNDEFRDLSLWKSDFSASIIFYIFSKIDAKIIFVAMKDTNTGYNQGNDSFLKFLFPTALIQFFF